MPVLNEFCQFTVHQCLTGCRESLVRVALLLHRARYHWGPHQYRCRKNGNTNWRVYSFSQFILSSSLSFTVPLPLITSPISLQGPGPIFEGGYSFSLSLFLSVSLSPLCLSVSLSLCLSVSLSLWCKQLSFMHHDHEMYRRDCHLKSW